jgi:hypothetical protein
VPAACGVVNVAATTGGPGGTTLDDGGTITPDGSSLVPPDASTATDGGFCSGSGPIIPVPGAGTTCTGDLPSRTFLFAVCACNDVSVSGVLTTDALNSSSGATGQSAGSIGANGAFDTNSQLLVQGDVWAASSGVATAVQVSQSGTITGDVHAGANVVAEQPLTIDGNLSANGSVTGTVTCGGTVTIPAGDTASATTADGGLVNAPVTVVPPCDCTNLLDVPTIVSGFASANDDSAAGLTPSSLSPAPATTVTLPCGRYYFDGINGSTVNLSIAGRAAVFVNGDLDALDHARRRRAARPLHLRQPDPPAGRDHRLPVRARERAGLRRRLHVHALRRRAARRERLCAARRRPALEQLRDGRLAVRRLARALGLVHDPLRRIGALHVGVRAEREQLRDVPPVQRSDPRV